MKLTSQELKNKNYAYIALAILGLAIVSYGAVRFFGPSSSQSTSNVSKNANDPNFPYTISPDLSGVTGASPKPGSTVLFCTKNATVSDVQNGLNLIYTIPAGTNISCSQYTLSPTGNINTKNSGTVSITPSTLCSSLFASDTAVLNLYFVSPNSSNPKTKF